ncbi:MAG: hypothetical protein K0U29_07195 [Gammaproteobacteria bacterium]|nr:hypothetical protein [Gammaproteobacteria bacterium]MCH9744697.1 hypothetical protein [Gammaproteobacteria bacterium]
MISYTLFNETEPSRILFGCIHPNPDRDIQGDRIASEDFLRRLADKFGLVLVKMCDPRLIFDNHLKSTWRESDGYTGPQSNGELDTNYTVSPDGAFMQAFNQNPNPGNDVQLSWSATMGGIAGFALLILMVGYMIRRSRLQGNTRNHQDPETGAAREVPEPARLASPPSGSLSAPLLQKGGTDGAIRQSAVLEDADAFDGDAFDGARSPSPSGKGMRSRSSSRASGSMSPVTQNPGFVGGGGRSPSPVAVGAVSPPPEALRCTTAEDPYRPPTPGAGP